MENIYVAPTSPPFRWRLIIKSCPLHQFRQYMVATFGFEAYEQAEAYPGQIILPVMEYRDMWTIAIFILDHY